jgi:tetratricopeptide (TPR) repeat protein
MVLWLYPVKFIKVRVMSKTEKYTLKEGHEKFAKIFNGRVWELLEQPDRSQVEDEEILLALCASVYHWRQVGTVVHEQRNQWLFARVYASLGELDKALKHARICLEITKSEPTEMQDFDIAYAHEGLARIYAQIGEVDRAREHYENAKAAGEAITNPGDREIFMGDFNTGNWYAFKID